jgi:hypothetical protein
MKIKEKNKVKLSRYRHAGAKERGARRLLILDLGTRLGLVVSVTPRPRFTPGKGPSVRIG